MSKGSWREVVAFFFNFENSHERFTEYSTVTF